MKLLLNHCRVLSLLCWAMGFTTPFAYAQIKEPAPLVPSTNAMNLGLFGEIPVSFNSGLADISIPIYTLQAGSLNVPITLSYHASGVRPDIHPSWVGLGWNLGAGGSISRKTYYAPDEWDVPNSVLNDRGYYFSHSRNSVSDWSSTANLKDINRDMSYDSSPDEFSFSFPGHSGKFFLDDAGNWQVQCNKPVKVKFDANDFIAPFPMNITPLYADRMTPTFNKFTLIDEAGIQYIFGEASAIEYSDDILQNLEPGKKFIASSWQLKRIISADGVDVVEFNYERGPFQSFLYQAINNKNINGYPDGVLDPACGSFYFGLTRSGNLISPVYLKSIEYQRAGVRIDFTTTKSEELNYTDQDYNNVSIDRFNNSAMENYSEVLDYNAEIPYFSSNTFPFVRFKRFIWLKLDKISIVDLGSNTSIKSVNFNYNNISTDRLKLLSLNFKDHANTNIQNYSFDYDPGALPNYLATRGDHWGFNNGSGPYNGADITNFFALREANDAFVRNGVLTAITYPTGGKSTFEYELHKYSASVNNNDRTVLDAVNGTAGGLRIKKITSIDNAGQQLVKEYFYVKNYTASANVLTLPSSGILDALPKYSFSLVGGLDINNVGFNYSMFSSNPIIPLSHTSTGQHISYSEVVEKRSDGAYTIYKYTGNDDGHNDDNAVNSWNRSQVPFMPINSRSFERGLLKSKVVYTNQEKIVQSEDYEFERLNSTGNGVRAVEQDFTDICAGSVASRQFYSRSAFLLYYYPFVVKKITTKNYQTGTGTDHNTTIQDFTYQNKLVKTTITTDSKLQQLKKENFYPENFTSTPVYNTMVQKNMLDYPVQIDQLKATQLKKRTKIDYKQWPNGGIYPEFVKEQIESNPLETSMQINDYDAKGNILSETPKNGITESFVWSYNQLLLVAKVTNADVSNIAYTSFETPAIGNWITSCTAISESTAPTGKKALLLSGNIYTTGLNASGVYNINVWTKNGNPNLTGANSSGMLDITVTEWVIKRTIGDWKLLEATANGVNSLTLSGNGIIIDELRLHPENSQMATYTYDPLIGMTSQCDVSNRITYYEYDGFKRLMHIRDENKNILKKICYNYAGQPETCNSSPIWQTIGQPRCKPCPANNNYTSNIQEHQEKDINPNSPTYNTFRWVDDGVSSNCLTVAAWEAISSTCELDGQGQTTGYELITEKDMNPCSSSYNQTRQIAVFNPGTCPSPNSCDCSSNGEGWACIGFQCEFGVQVITEIRNEAGTWFCTYHYEFSDGSWSGDYSIVSGSSC